MQLVLTRLTGRVLGCTKAGIAITTLVHPRAHTVLNMSRPMRMGLPGPYPQIHLPIRTELHLNYTPDTVGNRGQQG